MWANRLKGPSNNSLHRGFTIIELLIVIVVIGILAAITIIAFAGIQQKAHVAVLQSDLKGAVTSLKIAGVTGETYPPNLNGAALKSSAGTTYQYTYNSGTDSYCLTGTNNGIAYKVSSEDTTPTAGVCPGHTAPGNGGGQEPIANDGVVTTFAGSGSKGFANGPVASAKFKEPNGIAIDSSGTMYVADSRNHLIRKISPSGDVTTLAGSGSYGSTNGNSSTATFSVPGGIAVDKSGNVYVADQDSHLIRKVTPSGDVTTFAGSGTQGATNGNGTAAQFSYPSGVTIDSSGTLYVADRVNSRIRKISPSGDVTTLAGTGSYAYVDAAGLDARFAGPSGVAVDAAGFVYVADTNNNCIRKISPSGDVTTLAGSTDEGFTDGTGVHAEFNAPDGVAVDSAGTVYVTDTGNNRIRKITPDGIVTTLAGSGDSAFADGTGTSAKFNEPFGIVVDSSGVVYIGDTGNHRIRKIQ